MTYVSRISHVAVVGLGYIGLPTSAALAAHGVRVTGVDVKAHTIEEVNAGRVPFIEPDLDVAVSAAVASGLLTAQSEMPVADAFLIAVPTPFKRHHEPDLSYVQRAVESIAPKLEGGEVVILESTSPPGTTRAISEWLAALRPDLSFPHQGPSPSVHVAHCPERVLPGRIMVEMIQNDRVVGGLSVACADRAAALYAIFCTGEILRTDALSAELSKLAENSFRDVNIAYANELANICDRLDADVWEVIGLANHHPRVNILNPGPGVGGHCIAVDPWFLVAAAPEEAALVRQARLVNDQRPERVMKRIGAAAASNPHPVVALLGLSFKADIDDLRESPAVEIAELTSRLLDQRGDVLVVEPNIDHLPTHLAALQNVTLAGVDESLDRADVVVLLVDHRSFKDIPRSRLAGKAVIDTRGFWRS